MRLELRALDSGRSHCRVRMGLTGEGYGGMRVELLSAYLHTSIRYEWVLQKRGMYLCA